MKEDIAQLQEFIKAQDLVELKKDIKAKCVEYSSMSRVFTRDIRELINIRHNVVPEVEKLSAFMKQNSEYQRFCDEMS
jgi:hypothetical protein